jgi:hypothetical protein
MLVNRDETNPHTVRVVFEGAKKKATGFAGSVTRVTFGSEQYVWHDQGLNSYADPDGPPVASRIEATADTEFTLPKASITVLRGKVPGDAAKN